MRGDTTSTVTDTDSDMTLIATSAKYCINPLTAYFTLVASVSNSPQDSPRTPQTLLVPQGPFMFLVQGGMWWPVARGPSQQRQGVRTPTRHMTPLCKSAHMFHGQNTKLGNVEQALIWLSVGQIKTWIGFSAIASGVDPTRVALKLFLSNSTMM